MQVVVTVWTTFQTCHVIAIRHCHPSLPSIVAIHHCHPSLPFIRWAGDVVLLLGWLAAVE